MSNDQSAATNRTHPNFGRAPVPRTLKQTSPRPYDEITNGTISCVEARSHGIAPM